jgi:MATE family multidrug resistance protein
MQELQRIWTLAWPVVLGQLALVGMGVVDLFVVGAHGEVPLAALGLGHGLSYALLVVGLGTCQGIDPLVAQAWGRGRPAEAGTEAARGAVVVAVLAVPITALHFAATPILTALGQPAAAIPGAATYDAVLAAGVLPLLGFAIVRQLLQGAGVMRPATWVILAANVVNLVLDLWWVNGLGWGIAGAAWATVVVRWGMLFALIALGWSSLVHLAPDGVVFERLALLRVARKAMPVGWQIGLEVWAFNAALLLAGALGTTAAAAHTAALNAASVAFMVPLGVGAAAATRVGHLVGAGEDWRRAGWTAVAMGAGAMSVSGAVFLFAPTWVGRLYNPDPAVIAMVGGVLPLAAAFGFFDGVQVVAFGVLRGLGDTERPSLVNVVGYWLIGLPLGAWLGLRAGYGLQGVWIGLSVGLAIVAVLLVWRIRSWAVLPHPT